MFRYKHFLPFVLAFVLFTNVEKGFAQQSSLASEYSFKDATTSSYYTNTSVKSRKQWFALGGYFNVNFNEEYSIENPVNLGWGISAELFMLNYLSFYVQYTNSYSVDSDINLQSDRIYFGPRFYFGLFYFGVGAVKEYLSQEAYGYKVKSEVWDGYSELGFNFPVVKHLSIDLNTKITWGLGADDFFESDNFMNYSLSLGLKLAF